MEWEGEGEGGSGGEGCTWQWVLLFHPLMRHASTRRLRCIAREAHTRRSSPLLLPPSTTPEGRGGEGWEGGQGREEREWEEERLDMTVTYRFIWKPFQSLEYYIPHYLQAAPSLLIYI